MNERLKVQITDVSKFPSPIAALHRELSSPEWLETVSYIMRIPDLLADERLAGGGIHQTATKGRLDVHVDFNFLRDRQLYRRINILVYFNEIWKDEWGGQVELWDKEVKVLQHSFAPILNRCVIFETNEISFHGVVPVKSPSDLTRNSYAAYYYTREQPSDYTGTAHSTMFRARPNERIKGALLMPAEKAKRAIMKAIRSSRAPNPKDRR